MRITASLLVAVVVATSTLAAQDMRSRFRINPRGTRLTQAQAEELTLTVTQVAVRDVQTWVRTSGTVDATGKVITAWISGPDAAVVKVGQRARTFPVESRFSMYQARVVRVVPQGNRARIDVEIVSTGRLHTSYVVEVVTTNGDLLSVPNEAIIEEGAEQVVYVQTPDGSYEPRTIKTGIQGELYTQVLGGVKDGDQVVKIGRAHV